MAPPRRPPPRPVDPEKRAAIDLLLEQAQNPKLPEVMRASARDLVVRLAADPRYR
jgi:hypothetical protein